ncbi:hypothetical protein AALP_AA7G197600 [Arabis alpina]|uniref:Uncharacterized protein n=1 Tax=Arabis alpina TaxID=50452 RepID=A0A087GJ84_ARAAL|nr:hypothetical protein AALP_AA7G197600 [Arabis alpina]
MFMKAWAHLSRDGVISLPKSLTPSLDRSLVKDLTELDEQMIEVMRSFRVDKNNIRSLSRNPPGETGDDLVLATLVLSQDEVKRLWERVGRESDQSLLNLSTFVLAYAYTWTCLVKARGGDGERAVGLVLGGDMRTRLDPPLPTTYFGNCICSVGCFKRKAREFAGEKGFVTAVELISDMVKSLSSPGMIMRIAQAFATSHHSRGESSQFGSVSGSNRFGLYEMDFGWGGPVKVDSISIRGDDISLADTRDQSGGVQIGMCMKKTQMDIVFSVFNNGLQNSASVGRENLLCKK